MPLSATRRHNRGDVLNKNVVITEGEAVSVVSDPMAGEPRYQTAGQPAREIQPLVLDKNYPGDDGMYDFRPQPVESGRPDASPKDLSAVEPADSSMSEMQMELDFNAQPEKTAPAVKAGGKLKA